MLFRRIQKKTVSMLLFALLVILITSCSSTTEKNDPPESDHVPVDAQAGQEVFDKAIEATSLLESFSVNTMLEQKILEGGATTDMKSDISMEVVIKPSFAFKNTLSTKVAGQEQKIEMYLTDSGVYMFEPVSEQWMKVPADQSEQVLQGIGQQDLEPAKQLEKLDSYRDQLQVGENDHEYIIRLSAKGDLFTDFIKQEVQIPLANMDAANIKVNSMEYVFHIDKQQYYITDFSTDMDLEIDLDGQNMKTVQSIRGTYSDYNAIRPIVVPEEAKDAEEIRF